MIKDELKQIDLLLRRGRGREARARFDEINQRALPRALAADYAWVSWRLGAADQGLRLLRAHARRDRELGADLSPPELAEYAACLLHEGVTGEAEALLSELRAEGYPRVYLYRGFARAAQWDYAAAGAFFRRYLKAPRLAEYQRLVATANLAAALVYERRFTEARGMLSRLARDTSQRGSTLLFAVTLELRAVARILNGDYDEALTSLTEARRQLAETPGLDAFFIAKWEAIAILRSSPKSLEARHGVAKIRDEARARGHWETIRDCDRHEALATANERLAESVYFGTPFRAFRQKFALDFPPARDWGATKQLRIDGRGAPVEIDIARSEPRDPDIAPGTAGYRLFVILASDAYRPFSPGRLFTGLFPDERFLGASSAHRVRTAVFRLRRILKRAYATLTVEEIGGLYRLVNVGPPLRLRLPELSDPPLERLRAHFTDAPFSMKDAKRVTGVAPRTLNRVISAALASDVIRAEGAGPARRYRFIRKRP